MGMVLRIPDKGAFFRKQLVNEIDSIGINSLGIVAITSIFMGGVVTIQTAFNTDHPLLPIYAVGFATRQSIILEFSPTIISLILAGKVGSRIASEIGSMRVTEQIDALEVMGVNAANFLIFPKIIASLIINPALVVISMFLGIWGGWIVANFTDVIPISHYMSGIMLEFSSYDITYSLIKTLVFAFLITSISGYYGYFTKGGALNVGISSTKAVVSSSIFIIFFNLVLTQILLV